MDIITQIRTALDARGMTQRELARAIGHKSDSAVSRLLKGQHEPGDELLQAIATALDTAITIPAKPEVTIHPQRNLDNC